MMKVRKVHIYVGLYGQSSPHLHIFSCVVQVLFLGFGKITSHVGRAWEWMGWGKGGKEIPILIVLCLFL